MQIKAKRTRSTVSTRNKKVKVNSGQRLAAEAKCWRYKDIPIFSVKGITRSLESHFERLGKTQMIFVEGDAVDIARTMQYLIVDGLSENEKKSNYIVRKCSTNHEPFVIKTVREEKIIFDGTALMNEQGELLCYQCFELGMTVVDCDDHEKEKLPNFIDLATVEVGVGTTMDLGLLKREQYVIGRHYTIEQINFLLENKQARQPDVTRLANTDKFFLRTSLLKEE